MDISGGGAEGGGSSSVSGNVSASTQITMTTSLSGVASSLSGLASQMRMLSGEMAGMSAELQSDVLAINEKVNEITDTAYDLLYGEEDDLIVDSSAIDITLVTLGKVYGCENRGQISGDIGVGGITGAMAMEYEMDPEDDATVQMDAKQRNKYEIKAIVQECVNYGGVTAKRNYTGGIAGQMNLGMIVLSENYGPITSEGGDYVGGVAGIAGSTVRHCFAKCTLSGQRYVGGVCGNGVGQDLSGDNSTVAGCYTMVEIVGCEQYSGAISGADAGSFLENYFVSHTLSGINGMSYSGMAEPVSYQELLEKEILYIEQDEQSGSETDNGETAQGGEAAQEEESGQSAASLRLPEEFRKSGS